MSIGETHRFEKNLSRATKDEGKTEDDCSERYKRCQGVRRIENEKADKHGDDECDTEEDCVQFCKRGARVFYACDESLSFFIDSLDGLSHLFLGDIAVTVLVEYLKRSMLPKGIR